MDINNMSAGSGRITQDDNVVVNEANYIAPTPNGDQIISISVAGVTVLTPPNTNNIMAKIYVPVDCWVRFGAVPAINTGEYFAAGDQIVLESSDEISMAQIYVTGACTLFVAYIK